MPPAPSGLDNKRRMCYIKTKQSDIHMSLLFSRKCEYALQAVTFLALKPGGEKTTIKKLAGRLDIPYHFVAKILQNLTRKGLLISLKGPAGGFALAAPAEKITLLQIVEAIDGEGFAKNCVMGFPECSGKNPCALHEQWAGVRDDMVSMLSSRSISQVSEGMQKPAYRT
jgi:Rrf2 family iron-sulfur cluster assembly transcriptional regulator